MTDLILRPSGLGSYPEGEPLFALQLRDHGPVETNYSTLTRVRVETARTIVEAGAPFWLFDEPSHDDLTRMKASIQLSRARFEGETQRITTTDNAITIAFHDEMEKRAILMALRERASNEHPEADPGAHRPIGDQAVTDAPYTDELTPENKAKIDGMSRMELARMWRFAPPGEPLLQGKTGKYFEERFNSLGGFSPEISKALGWG